MFVCFFSKKHKEVVPKHKHRAPQSQPCSVIQLVGERGKI